MKAGKKAKKGGGGRNGGGPKNIPVSCSVESGGLPVERIGRYSQRVGTVGPVYLGAEERDSVRKINGMSSRKKFGESSNEGGKRGASPVKKAKRVASPMKAKEEHHEEHKEAKKGKEKRPPKPPI